MSLYPIFLPDEVEITSIRRTSVPINSTFEYNPEAPVPVDVSNGACNMFVVEGFNLTKITEVHWYPVLQSNILFKMVPWRIFSDSEATFGIFILEQDLSNTSSNARLSFRTRSGNTGSVPSVTFSKYPWLFNPVVCPILGVDDGGPTGSGGAY